MKRSRILRAALAGLAVCLVAAACGSGGGSGAGASAAGGLTPGPAPTKGDLSIFFINAQGASSGASYPEGTKAAQAAVEYINKNLGGINGYTLKMETCFTDETPAATINCANKAAAAKPTVTVVGSVGGEADVYTVLANSGVPYFSNWSATTKVLSAGPPTAYVINSVANTAVLGMAQDMKQRGVTRAGIIYVDAPGAIDIVDSTAPGFAKAGIAIQRVPVPYPSPDLTSAISALQAEKPEAMLVLADPTTCLSALKAATSLAWDKPIYASGSCESPTFAQATAQITVPVITTAYNVDLNSDDPDVKAYSAAMAAYAPDQKDLTAYHSLQDFQGIMNLSAVLRKAAESGPVTSQGLVQAMQGGPYPLFMMGSGKQFTCNGTVYPQYKSVCTAALFLSQYENGKPGVPKPVDTSALVG